MTTRAIRRRDRGGFESGCEAVAGSSTDVGSSGTGGATSVMAGATGLAAAFQKSNAQVPQNLASGIRARAALRA